VAAKTVVILGAGTGGLVAAHRLRRMLDKEHRVILVDRSPVYSFAPSYTWVMLGMRDGRRISRDVRSVQKKGVEFVWGEIQAIDPGNKRVVVNASAIEYDYLIVALGAEYSSDEIPGLGQCWTFYHLDGADGLSERLQTFAAGRVALVVSALPVKCPAAPYEGALLLDDHFRRRGLRADIDIQVYTPEAAPLISAGQSAGTRVLELLSSRRVGFTPSARLAEVDQRSTQMRFSDGSTSTFDLLIATPVHTCPAVLRQSGLANEGGWVPVDRETLTTGFEDVYAIGDATEIPLSADRMLPKTGVFAHGQAEVVSRNIAAEIAGAQPIWAFGGQGNCFLSTEARKAAIVSGNFFAEPTPDVELRGPNRRWHWAKLGFERLWLWRWF
jgi:sulfide:quinone oxidoreductase